VGSGEYLESMAPIESRLLEGRARRYVQIATASVPDGPEVVAKWHRLGAEQAERLGAEQVVVDVESRDDADRPGEVAKVEGAGLIYLSGGHPGFLADTLRGSSLWAAIVEAWRGGAAVAGCSAGAMAMTSWVPSIRRPRDAGTRGLGLVPHLRVIPHFDAFAARVPDIAARFVLPRETGVTLVGIDEQTAIVGGTEKWSVEGRSSAWVLTRAGRQQWPAGTTLLTPEAEPDATQR
jgi:cyanophycinase-like exopeptidase